MKRRSFLKKSIAATTLAAASPQIIAGMLVRANSPLFSFAPNVAEMNDNILIVIQLFGGNDALNTVIPIDNSKYYDIRPTLAIKKADAWQYLSTDMYFHPSLVKNAYQASLGKAGPNGGFGELMMNGRLAVIQDVGYDQPNLSHFRSTDIWLSGINPVNDNVRLDDGWIARYIENALPDFPTVLPAHPLCVQIGGSLSLLFQSKKGDTGIALTDPQKFFDLGQGLSPDEEALSDGSAYADEFNFIRSVAEQSDSYSQVVLDAYKSGVNKVNYGKGSLATQLGLVARLISGGLKSKVYMLSASGFDTHVQQQDADNPQLGNHPALLADLANAVAMFMHDAQQQQFATRVVGLTVSEFGRRPYENGSRGTDHGASGVQFVFGDGYNVQSSRFGNAPDLSNVDKDGDVVYQNDYRTVYAAILQNWFYTSEDDMRSILQLQPNDVISPSKVIIRHDMSVRDVFNGNGNDALRVNPNPTSGEVSISFELDEGSDIRIDIFNTRGQRVVAVKQGWLSPGPYRFTTTIDTTGMYVCMLRAGNQVLEQPITVLR